MTKRLCSIEDCDNKHFGKGYCNKHYRRIRRNGTLETTRRKKYMTDKEIKDFVLSNIIVDVESNCWIWQKCITEQGYGQTSHNGRHEVVHRLLYKLMVDTELPNDTYLDHENCISRACGNPYHVRPVTKAQNNSHRVTPQPSNVSGYRNVSYRPTRSKPYRVVIQKEGKQLYFGSYLTAEEANEVAIKKREELFGDFAGTV